MLQIRVYGMPRYHRACQLLPTMERIRYSIETRDAHAPDLSCRQLDVGIWRIGRGSECAVRIDAKGISREHAEIVIFADGGCIVRDLKSTNGTKVDGLPIRERAVSGSFELDLGGTRLALREHVGEPAGLAFRTGVEVDEAPVAAEQRRTQQQSLSARLNAATWHEFAKERATFDAVASRLVSAWCDALGLSVLRLVGADGKILAAAGTDACLVTIAESGAWRLLADTDSAAQHPRLSAVLTPLLAMLPDPEPADTSAAPSPPRPPGVASRHDPMLRRIQALGRVARTRVNVLLLGETGVGKERLARWVHDCSPRRAGPYLAINCAALPRDLLEAELFGVERGAATGVDARPGVFERASGGTLFLDELGDTPAETQVRLLRVLEEGRVLRIGGREPRPIDVRLVGATHRDLHEEVRAGRFRLDLFHRLAGLELTLPPLRERPEDVTPLATHFFQRALSENAIRSPGMTMSALTALQAFDWPGNVRELRQVVETATAMLHPGEALDRIHLPARFQGLALKAEEVESAGSPTLPDDSLDAAVRRAECTALRAAIERHGTTEAAWRSLGIGKTSFYKKLREHDLGRDED